MTAETVLSIIEALNEKEKQRLLSIILNKKKDKKPNKELEGWSEKEVRIKLLSTIFKTRRTG